MARYIDSEPLEKFYQDTLDDISGMKEYEECAEYCKKALDNLKEQPTIEAIPRERIDEMIAEIHSLLDFWGRYKKNRLVYDILEVIDKYCGGKTNELRSDNR